MRPRPRHEQGVGGHSVGRSEAGGGPLPRAEAVAPSRERACGAAARQPGARRRQRRTLLCAGMRFLAQAPTTSAISRGIYSQPTEALHTLSTPAPPTPLPPLDMASKRPTGLVVRGTAGARAHLRRHRRALCLVRGAQHCSRISVDGGFAVEPPRLADSHPRRPPRQRVAPIRQMAWRPGPTRLSPAPHELTGHA